MNMSNTNIESYDVSKSRSNSNDELQLAARAGMILLEQNEALKLENEQLLQEIEEFRQAKEDISISLDTKATHECLGDESITQTDTEDYTQDERKRLNEFRRKSIAETNGLLQALSRTSRELREEQETSNDLRQQLNDATRQIESLECVVHHMQTEKEIAMDSMHVSQPKDCEVDLKNPFGIIQDIQTRSIIEDDEETAEEDDEPNSFDSIESSEKDMIYQLENELEQMKIRMNQMKKEETHLMESVRDLEAANVKLIESQAKDRDEISRLKENVESKEAEQEEERDLIRHLRSVVESYKVDAEEKIVCNSPSSSSIGMELTKENNQLHAEVEKLRLQLSHYADASIGTVTSSENNNQDYINSQVEDKEESSSPSPTEYLQKHSFETRKLREEYHILQKKYRNTDEKLLSTRKELYHTKQQWSQALSTQQYLEEALEESKRVLNQRKKDFQMHCESCLLGNSVDHGKPSGSHRKASSNLNKIPEWELEKERYPPPPGDLNSPLIQCLLDTWTRDKCKLMDLADWLHTTIRGTGTTNVLQLHNLSSDVSAGFLQIFIPILQSQHPCHIEVFKRERQEITTDLIFKTITPSTSISTTTSTSYSTETGSLGNMNTKEADFLYG